MFLPKDELQCGVFDSTVLRGNRVKSSERYVVNYELELFHRENAKWILCGTMRVNLNCRTIFTP